MFCTYITFYSGRLLPPFYIGYTTINKIEQGYHGSVSSIKYKTVWLSELQENPQLFKTVIIRVYSTRQEAKQAEEYIQCKLDVVNNTLYSNMHIANAKFYCSKESGQKAANTRRIRGTNIPSREVIQKRADSNRGRVVSESTRQKISVKHKGRKRSPDIIAKVIAARKASMAAKRPQILTS